MATEASHHAARGPWATAHAVADGRLISRARLRPQHLCDRLPQGAPSRTEGADRKDAQDLRRRVPNGKRVGGPRQRQPQPRPARPISGGSEQASAQPPPRRPVPA
jgi:hypothetical protein